MTIATMLDFIPLPRPPQCHLPPQLTIDELLEELGCASWFLKLDLSQGFHQICIAAEDILSNSPGPLSSR